MMLYIGWLNFIIALFSHYKSKYLKSKNVLVSSYYYLKLSSVIFNKSYKYLSELFKFLCKSG